LLKFESNLICASYRYGKMIVASYYAVNTMMTEQLGHLLHMDTVGSSRIRSMGGKWYILVIVDNYLCYSWVFFLKSKDEVFKHFQSLGLRLNNEHPNCLKAIQSDNATELGMPHSISFVLNMVLINNSQSHVCLNKMGLWNVITILLLKWLGRCLMSMRLLDIFGLKQSILHVIFQIEFSCARS
jgi:hypothetical protein